MDSNEQLVVINIAYERTVAEIEREKQNIQRLKQDYQQQLQQKEARLVKLEGQLENLKKSKQKLSENVIDLTEDDDDTQKIKQEPDAEVQQMGAASEDERKPAARKTGRSRGSAPSYREHSESSEEDEEYDPTVARARGQKRKGQQVNQGTKRQKKQGPATTTDKKKKSIDRNASMDKHPGFKGQTSVGKTRDQLNKNTKLIKHFGGSKFSQGVVRTLNHKVYALVFNDEWNELAASPDELQDWYVGTGERRKQLAEMVANNKTPIPIFHSPKKRKTNTIFYVGHYKVAKFEVFATPKPLGKKFRQMRLSFQFVSFCQKLAEIVKEG